MRQIWLDDPDGDVFLITTDDCDYYWEHSFYVDVDEHTQLVNGYSIVKRNIKDSEGNDEGLSGNTDTEVMRMISENTNGKCDLCEKENVTGFKAQYYCVEGSESVFLCDECINGDTCDHDLADLIESRGRVWLGDGREEGAVIETIKVEQSEMIHEDQGKFSMRELDCITCPNCGKSYLLDDKK